jgi:hypothetical protein
MRVMVFVKATEECEAGILPSQELQRRTREGQCNGFRQEPHARTPRTGAAPA